MKLFWRSQIIGLAAIISTINYRAMVRAESKPSQPPPELNRLEYFQGTWRCQQPAKPETPVGKFTWTVRRDLNGFWYVGNAEETQSPTNSQPVNSQEFLGYNTASKKLVRSVVVGNGNSFNLTASDWQDDKLIWSGTVVDKGQSIPLREEIIQDSSDRFTATYFIADKDSKWKPVVNETCDRLK